MLNRIRGSRVTLYCRLMGSNESSNFLSGVGFDRVCKTLTPNLMILMAIEQCDSYNKPRLMPDVI